MAFTESQRSAIEHPGGNLLLSAAAGSGKTTVLVERVIHLTLEGHSIDNMLIVTFTRAAASDMREKLFRAFGARSEESAHLREQLDLLETASVTTLHSFCLSLLRTYFEAAQVDPAFRLMDDAESSQMERRALEDAMETCYGEYSADKDHISLVCGRSARAVRELALSMHHFLMKRPDPYAFAELALERLTDGETFLNELCEALKRRLREARALILQALALARAEACLKAYIAPLEADEQALRGMIGMPASLGALYGALSVFSLSALPRASGHRGPGHRGRFSVFDENTENRPLCPEALAGQVKSLRNRAKDILDREKRLMIDIPLALSDLCLSAGPLRALLRIVRKMDENLELLKRERMAYTYDDLEARALLLLRHEDIASSLREKYAFVFVDEYQDISDMQEALIRNLAREDNLFMVGDVKQSIYRFRDAEPSLFNEKYRRFSDGNGGRVIALSQNFRSRPAILSLVNDVFERVFGEPDAEIEYDGAARLYPGMEYPAKDPAVELHIVRADASEREEEPSEDELFADDKELSRIEREAVLAARRIRMLMGQEIYDAKKGVNRKVEYRDIAVIARTNGALDSVLNVLKEFSIPAYAEGTGSAFDTLEVKTAMSLLEIIDNRRLDIPYIACLRSPIVALSSEELARIRENSPEGMFRDACVTYLEKRDEIAERLAAFEETLDRYRRLSRALPLAQFVSLALRETGYLAFASMLPGGVQRAANLNGLIDKAGEFERSRGGSLTAFVAFIKDVIKSGGKFPAARALGEGEDAVQLTTAHKSKGLEFPIVIAVDLSKNLLKKPGEGELLTDRDLGFGMHYNDPELTTRRETIARRAIQERSRIRDLNEEMRVLYVLLTRARERLILIGTVKDLDGARLRWTAAGASLPGSYLDAIAPAVALRPGGEALSLRQDIAMGDGAPVDVRVIDGEDLRLSPSDLPDDSNRILFSIERALSERPDPAHPMNDKYPYERDVLLPVKLTVTGLLIEAQGALALPKLAARPRFMTEASLTSAERGTLLHAALQGLTLPKLNGLSGDALLREIDGQLAELLERRVIFERPDARLLCRFFEGETGRRLLQAKSVYRECPFNLRVRAGDVVDAESDEAVLLQGVIDCFFYEDGRGYTLLDYKSDAADADEIAARYERQLSLYALALSRITGEKVYEKRIVLLRAGQDIVL